MIHRYSSRRSPLKDFLVTQLQGASRYDRIAGFFSSSLLEVAGEALERMTPEGAARPAFGWCATPASTLWTLRLSHQKHRPFLKKVLM